MDSFFFLNLLNRLNKGAVFDWKLKVCLKYPSVVIPFFLNIVEVTHKKKRYLNLRHWFWYTQLSLCIYWRILSKRNVLSKIQLFAVIRFVLENESFNCCFPYCHLINQLVDAIRIFSTNLNTPRRISCTLVNPSFIKSPSAFIRHNTVIHHPFAKY